MSIKNYEIETNNNKEITRIMQKQPYKRVYPYKNVGNVMVKQEKVKLSTLRSGLRRGNWGLY